MHPKRVEDAVFDTTAWCAMIVAAAAVAVLIYLVLAAWGFVGSIGTPQNLG